MLQKYSRQQSVEERRNFRSALILLILTVLLIVGLIVYGIPAVSRVANFVSDLRGGGSPIKGTDKTPPAPPRFNAFPDFTNQQHITLSGTAESGTTLNLTLNGKEQETVVDKDGKFTFPDLGLKEGENTFSAIAIDGSGNKSQQSASYTVLYDIKPPEITIDTPTDGTKFFGSTQRQINIQGKTEVNGNVTISDRLVTVDGEGKFTYPVTLNSGDNQFTIKVIDQAGNSAEKSITLNFSE